MASATTIPNDLASECLDLARRARIAAGRLAVAPGASKDSWLRASADALEDRCDDVLAANEQDVGIAENGDLTAAQIDRLRLTPSRLRSAADGLREVAALPDPVGQIRESRVRPNGLEGHKVGA